MGQFGLWSVVVWIGLFGRDGFWTGHTGLCDVSKMQMASSEMLHVNASVLVGLAAMVTMGPANPLKHHCCNLRLL